MCDLTPDGPAAGGYPAVSHGFAARLGNGTHACYDAGSNADPRSPDNAMHGRPSDERPRPLRPAHCLLRSLQRTTTAAVLTIAGTAIAETEIPKGPRLLLTRNAIIAARDKAAQHDWAATILRHLVADAERWAARTIDPPAEGGGWAHNYVCPKDADQLKFDEASPHKHWCARCKSFYEGKKLDDAWAGYVHQSYAQAAETCALAFQLTGKQRYADWSRDVLLWYAERYASFPVHGEWAGRGKVTGQSLDESVWLIRVASAFDLIAEALTEEQRRTILDRLVVPAAEHIEKYAGDVHNIECWQATARLMAGLLAGRADLRNRAVASLRRNIDHGISEEGFWYEGSPSYHMYTLMALTPALLVARNNEITLGDRTKLIGMYTVPGKLVLPGYGLPALNDGWNRGSLGSMATLLETACYLFDHASLRFELALIYGRQAASRTSRNALLYGPATLPTRAEPDSESHAMRDIGLVVLRHDGYTVIVKAGGRHGGHDHPDRLNLILAGRYRNWLMDFGTPGYGHPLYRTWYRHTASHNTVTVDGQPQAINTRGRIIRFDDARDYKLASVECNDAYPGVKMMRTVAIVDGLVLDRFEVASDEPHAYTLMLHGPPMLTFPDYGRTTKRDEDALLEFGPAKLKPLVRQARQCSAAWIGGPTTRPVDPAGVEAETHGTWLDPAANPDLGITVGASEPIDLYYGLVPGPPGDKACALALHAKARRIIFAIAYRDADVCQESVRDAAVDPDGTARFRTAKGNTYCLSATTDHASLTRPTMQQP